MTFPDILCLAHPPRRVISLVPSLTESLFNLELGSTVVGITDYCIYPAEALKNIPRVGGPKNPRCEDILALEPDLVLANQEENTRQVVDGLQAAGLNVWVTFPQTVRQSLDVLWTLVGLFQHPHAAMHLKTLETTLEWTRSAATNRDPMRYFCPVWHDQTQNGQPWWMTFNRLTYCHDVLQTLGGLNAFADRERRYPLEADLNQAPAQASGDRDTRYPRVGLEEIRAADPEIILLPNEPFPFDEIHRQELCNQLSDVMAIRKKRIYLVDGSLITWHGTRLARALHVLPALFGR